MQFRNATPPPALNKHRFAFKVGVPLSRREQQVLWMMCRGLAPIEIAEALHRAHQTITTYRKSLRAKTGCRTEAQLGVWAVRQGVV